MDKDLKDWTFEELVNYCSWDLMQSIVQGTRLTHAVQNSINMALRWKAAKDQAEKEAKKGK